MGYYTTLTLDCDVSDVLDQIDDSDIIKYCQKNNINIPAESFDYKETISEEDLVYLIQQKMNHGRECPQRTKKELKEYISQLIDFHVRSIE